MTKTGEVLVGKIGRVLLSVCITAFLTAGAVFSGIALAKDGCSPDKLVAETRYGMVMGYQGEENTLVWKGIPFAQPPVGKLRWRAPKDPKPWYGVLNTQQFSNACPQFSVSNGSLSLFGSEDCLYLNIWRPVSRTHRLPVYFWIHGGGDSTGAASIAYFDGTMIASKSNLVVVSIQYRLGALGWFTNPALRTDQNPFNASGNYGTLDIIKALKWVRENIEAFGGDPDNVTIVGESAGAANVQSLLISPAARGLFHKAISESGYSPLPLFVGFPPQWGTLVPLSVGDSYSGQVLAKLTATDPIPAGETVADYLRSRSVQELYSALPPGALPPVSNFGMLDFPYIFTDGAVINANGVNALDDPKSYNQVPLMIGTNLEEFKLFLFSSYGVSLPNGQVLAGDVYQEVAEVESNIWKQAGVDSIANKMSAHHSQPGVYAYQLLYGKPPEYYPQFVQYAAWPRFDYHGPFDYALLFGAWHTMDLPFFFDTFSAYDEYFLGASPSSPFLFRADNAGGYTALSNAMMAYAAQFARTGNPNGVGPQVAWWHKWQEAQKRILLDADQNSAVIQMEQ